MSAFLLSPEAAQDITEIYEFIAQDNMDAAERVRVEILDAMRGLAEMPGRATAGQISQVAPSYFGQ